MAGFSSSTRIAAPKSVVWAVMTDHVRYGDWGRASKVVLEREAALARAVALASPGDVVLAAGKGHEVTQEIRGERRPFPARANSDPVIAKCPRPKLWARYRSCD